MTESQDALAHLAWQVELGADEAILDAPGEPVRGGGESQPGTVGDRAGRAGPASRPPREGARQGRRRRRRRGAGAGPGGCRRRPAGPAGRACGFEACELRHGARNLVFSDGNPAGARDDRGRGTGPGRGHPGQALRRARGAASGRDAACHRAVAHRRRRGGRGLHHQHAALATAAEPRSDAGGNLDAAALRAAARGTGGAGGPDPHGQLGLFRPSGQARHHPDARQLGGDAGPPRAADVPPGLSAAQPGGQAGGLGGPPVAQGETSGGP
jgi:hypothetical protein